ncbi:ABC transporter permease [Actinomadura monticuli]|uniref:ABC transporter permease n=1 Tax=Actinomadura monticuli TaxID=3097367 RepID=A0ABV4QI89_9ACTN
MISALTGMVPLTRLAFRRDRIVLPAWVLAMGALLASFTAMFATGMPTHQDVVQEAEMMAGNPGMRMIGMASGATIGGITLIRGYAALAVMAALMSTLAVVRHTRQNEETGRAELVGAAVVGRYAGLASAVMVTVIANVALMVAMALAMAGNGQPVAGSVTAGVSFGAVGIVFAGVAAVTAQLSSTTRGANGLAAAAVGAAFLLAGAGNMLGHVDATGVRVVSAWPAWLSPLGWGQQMRPFDHGPWWPLLLFGALFALLLSVAGMLAGRRDMSRGILPERRGNAVAARRLLSPFGLAWRLQRGLLLGWTAGMLGFGLIFGSISDQARHAEGAALDWYRQLGAHAPDQLTAAFQASMIEMAALGAAVYIVQVLLRMRAEEVGGTLESVLTTPVSRPRWVVSHVANACLGTTVLLLVFGTSMALTAGAVLGGTSAQLRDLVAGGLVQLPAVLLIGGVVVAAVGLLPRAAGAVSWTVLILATLLGPVFGPSLNLPDRMLDLSPFTHIPKVPLAGVTPVSAVVLLALSAALATTGIISTRRRDIALPA